MKIPQTIKFMLCVILLFTSISAFAQKRATLTEEEQVQEAVSTEIDAVFKSKDFLKVKNKKWYFHAS